MAVLLVSALVFTASALVLALVQRLRGAPLPAGCTPRDGQCCGAQAVCEAQAGNCTYGQTGSGAVRLGAVKARGARSGKH